MAQADLPIYANVVPRPLSVGGLSVREDVLFTDAKGKESDRSRKKAEKLLEDWRGILSGVLEPNETVFHIVKNCQAPVSALGRRGGGKSKGVDRPRPGSKVRQREKRQVLESAGPGWAKNQGHRGGGSPREPWRSHTRAGNDFAVPGLPERADPAELSLQAVRTRIQGRKDAAEVDSADSGGRILVLRLYRAWHHQRAG